MHKKKQNLELLLSSFKALSDPLRLEILEILKNQEMCVGDIYKFLNIKQPKVSFHLKILRESSLVNMKRQGRYIFYSLNQDYFTMLVEYLDDF
jgi:ArsR family transcriptional regulator